MRHVIRLAFVVAAAVAALGVTAALLAWAALAAVSPPKAVSSAQSAAPAWTLPLRLTLFGRRFELEASVPVLLRGATHPLAARLLDGRHIDTAHGRWQLAAAPDRSVIATCAPCRLDIAALGPAPLSLDRVQLTIAADGADTYHGSLRVGAEAQTLSLHWRGQIDRRGRMHLKATLPASPLQHAVQVFGTDLPERGSVQVEGQIALSLDAHLPAGPWRVQPRIEGFAVAGLGTERLLDLQRPAACRDGSEAGVKAVGGWLPRAVVAAEDQRFFEHPGYDLAALTGAWQHNQSSGAALAGASTLTQQLAKLVITGDDRSAARKLRELLYAVEMERTLGKARILQLYLALAPWGEGVCGAERAVRVHLGQRDASTVGPVAAAWLASLLPQPDTLLRAEQRRGEVDAARVARVIEGLRPMKPERREKALAMLPFWSPPALTTRRLNVASGQAPTALVAATAPATVSTPEPGDAAP